MKNFFVEDMSTSKDKELSYYNYDYFELDKLSDDECLVRFRFLKNGIYQLAEALGLPEEMKCYNGVKFDSFMHIFKTFCLPLLIF